MGKIGFGGGCHWCTEAVYQSLIGVHLVEQGWASSTGSNSDFSEAVIVHFDESIIATSILINIHLHTHSCTSLHHLRDKYRSAIYTYNNQQAAEAKEIIEKSQKDFDEAIITKVLPLISFKLNSPEFLNYYYTDPQRQFCKRYIDPKLQYLMDNYTKQLDKDKLKGL